MREPRQWDNFILDLLQSEMIFHVEFQNFYSSKLLRDKNNHFIICLCIKREEHLKFQIPKSTLASGLVIIRENKRI